jgi:hypothetical protein
MTNDMRRWGITISRIKTADGDMSDNLEATSLSGGPQIHCDLKNVRWSNVIEKFRKLPRVPALGGVDRRPFRLIDDDRFNRPPGRFQFQAELLLNGRKKERLRLPRMPAEPLRRIVFRLEPTPSQNRTFRKALHTEATALLVTQGDHWVDLHGPASG